MAKNIVRNIEIITSIILVLSPYANVSEERTASLIRVAAKGGNAFL
jgi:hypothetical protein